MEFHNLLTLFHDDYTDEDMPHWTKIHVAILDMWRLWFGQLKQELMVSMIYQLNLLYSAKLSTSECSRCTADKWSDRCHQSYICITVYWIAYERPAEQAGLVFKSSLLAFHALPRQHTGLRIAQAVYQLLDRAGVNGGDVSINSHVML
jgi:hypothetical protein